jgi:hypothetical protein
MSVSALAVEPNFAAKLAMLECRVPRLQDAGRGEAVGLGPGENASSSPTQRRKVNLSSRGRDAAARTEHITSHGPSVSGWLEKTRLQCNRVGGITINEPIARISCWMRPMTPAEQNLLRNRASSGPLLAALVLLNCSIPDTAPGSFLNVPSTKAEEAGCEVSAEHLKASAVTNVP